MHYRDVEVMAKRICPIHGLWNKIEDKDRCPKCKTTNNRSYDKNIRNKESNKFYHSKAWKEVRLIVLRDNPFCIECGHAANTDLRYTELVVKFLHKPFSRGGV